MARGTGDLPQVRPGARSYAVARLAADVGLRINEARMLDVWGHFDSDHTRLGAPPFLSERKNRDAPAHAPQPRCSAGH